MSLSMDTAVLHSAASGFTTAGEYAAAGATRLAATTVATGAFGTVASGSALADALTSFGQSEQAVLTAATATLDTAAQRLAAVITLAVSAVGQTTAVSAG